MPYKVIINMVKLFLDDVRDPKDCLGYMYKRIGKLNPIYDEEWVVAKDYDQFILLVESFFERGIEISHISFDHDLAEGHYHKNMQEGVLNYDAQDFDDNANKTGYHCAKWLKTFYEEKGLELPKMFVHSMNPVGTQNIINAFK